MFTRKVPHSTKLQRARRQQQLQQQNPDLIKTTSVSKPPQLSPQLKPPTTINTSPGKLCSPGQKPDRDMVVTLTNSKAIYAPGHMSLFDTLVQLKTTTEQKQQDAANILLWSINSWYKQSQGQSGHSVGRHSNRRKAHNSRLKAVLAHEDEKSLCNGDWKHDFSLDRPTYGTVLLQIKEANTESEGPCEFIKKTAEILASTILVTIFLGAFMALPVGMITVGVKYLNECPKEPKIPIYLLVGGCFGLLKLLSLLWKQVKSRRYDRIDEVYDAEEDNGDLIVSKSSQFTETVLSLFLFSWFVCGNFWTFHIWKPEFVQPLHDPTNWCDTTVYMFAVIQIFGCYALMGMILVLSVVLAVCHQCLGSDHDES